MVKIKGGVLPAVMPAFTKYTADPARMQWVSSLYASFNALKLIVAQVQEDLKGFETVSETPMLVEFMPEDGSQGISQTVYLPVQTEKGLTCYVKGGAAYELLNDSVNKQTWDKAFQPLDLHNFVDPTGDFDINVLSPRMTPVSANFLDAQIGVVIDDMVKLVDPTPGGFNVSFPTFDFRVRKQMNPVVTAQLKFVFASLQRHVETALATQSLTLINLQPMTVAELKASLQSHMNVKKEALRPQSGFMHTQVGLLHIVSFYNEGTFPRVMLCAKVGDVIDHIFDFMVPDEIQPFPPPVAFDYTTVTFWVDDTIHAIYVMAPRKLMQDNFEALMERRLKLLYERGADHGETMLKAFNHLGRMMFLLEIARSKRSYEFEQVMQVLTDIVHLPLMAFNNGVYTKVYRKVDLPDFDSMAQHVSSLDFTRASFPFYKLVSQGQVQVVQIPLPVLINAYGPAFPGGRTGFPPFDALLDPALFDAAHAQIEAYVEGNGRQRMANMNALLRSIYDAAARMDTKRYEREMAARRLRSDIEYFGNQSLARAESRARWENLF
jgi:hypothetical protein